MWSRIVLVQISICRGVFILTGHERTRWFPHVTTERPEHWHVLPAPCSTSLYFHCLFMAEHPTSNWWPCRNIYVFCMTYFVYCMHGCSWCLGQIRAGGCDVSSAAAVSQSALHYSNIFTTSGKIVHIQTCEDFFKLFLSFKFWSCPLRSLGVKTPASSFLLLYLQVSGAIHHSRSH